MSVGAKYRFVYKPCIGLRKRGTDDLVIISPNLRIGNCFMLGIKFVASSFYATLDDLSPIL